MSRRKIMSREILHLPPKSGNRDKLYGRRWRRLRQQYLADHPLCVFCTNEGRVSTATELDHIQKHEGNPELFYDVENLQGLCAHHHRSTKAQMERTGGIRGSRPDGTPLDPDHYWIRNAADRP